MAKDSSINTSTISSHIDNTNIKLSFDDDDERMLNLAKYSEEEQERLILDAVCNGKQLDVDDNDLNEQYCTAEEFVSQYKRINSEDDNSNSGTVIDYSSFHELAEIEENGEIKNFNATSIDCVAKDIYYTHLTDIILKDDSRKHASIGSEGKVGLFALKKWLAVTKCRSMNNKNVDDVDLEKTYDLALFYWLAATKDHSSNDNKITGDMGKTLNLALKDWLTTGPYPNVNNLDSKSMKRTRDDFENNTAAAATTTATTTNDRVDLPAVSQQRHRFECWAYLRSDIFE